MTTAVEARDVFRVHSTPEGDAAALQGLTLSVADGRDPDRARPERLGQDDAPAHPRRARPALGRIRARASATTCARSARRGRSRYRAGAVGYLDQHYARALAPELTAQRARRA